MRSGADQGRWRTHGPDASPALVGLLLARRVVLAAR